MTYTIDHENNIIAFSSAEEAQQSAATPIDMFGTREEFRQVAGGWPAARLVDIWNSLPGVTPVKRFKDRQTGLDRIWARIEDLGSAAAQAPPVKSPKTRPEAVPPAAKAKHPAPRAAESAKAAAPSAPREGSKAAQVVALLRRKGGASLGEIMQQMNWQAHTVRGFLAGSLKKAGYRVESFQPAGGKRTYRIAR